MNHIKEFNFKGKSLRTIQIADEPFFVGKDSAMAIGYTEVSFRRAIKAHVKDKYKRECQIDTPSGKQMMIVISEPGLYQLASQSKLPNAGPFQDWVYENVLPSIRKNGAYLTDSAIEKTLTDPDYLIRLATQLKSERNGRLIAEKKVDELKPKASYYDQVLSNPSLMNITAIAKDYGYSGRTFNKLLYKLKIQYPQSGTWFLYAKYQDKGWTQSKTVPYTNNKSSTGTGSAVQTKWTQKGRLGIYKELKKYGIVPMIEQLAIEV